MKNIFIIISILLLVSPKCGVYGQTLTASEQSIVDARVRALIDADQVKEDAIAVANAERIEAAKIQAAVDAQYKKIKSQKQNERKLYGVKINNKIRTSNIGPVAVDAKWSNYGIYLQRMIETVQIEWERILIAGKVYPNSGSYVQVKFIMNSKGEITKIVRVDPTGAPSDAAIRACEAGITARSPYGQWTEDMIAVLGEQQEMTFVFYYE